MSRKIFKIALLTFLCVVIVQTGLLVQVQGAPKKPTNRQVPAANSNNQPTTETIYQKAKKDLPEDLYISYRVIDRLARANGIDETPWRLGIFQEYQINAFATEANLIALYTGLLDQVAGDPSAVAFIIGHEMGHHTKRHLAVAPAAEAALREQIKKEAEEQVQKEINSAQTESTGAGIGGNIARTIGGIFGGWGNVGGSAAGEVADNVARERIARAEKRVQEIEAQKNAELDERLAQESRTLEFEADEVGYKYMATAGFESDGCLRAMTVLGRLPGSEVDSTHPAVPKRIEKLKELMAQYPASTLAERGKLSLNTRKQPLSYQPSKDGQSLRINSRHGGSGGDSFDRLFGQ